MSTDGEHDSRGYKTNKSSFVGFEGYVQAHFIQTSAESHEEAARRNRCNLSCQLLKCLPYLTDYYRHFEFRSSTHESNPNL
jgi:hypothetical protein